MNITKIMIFIFLEVIGVLCGVTIYYFVRKNKLEEKHDKEYTHKEIFSGIRNGKLSKDFFSA